MILKERDDKQGDVEQLQALLTRAPQSVAGKIASELRTLQAGVRGEKESSYYIDFQFRDSQNYVVIHDLRLDIDGQVAQIDDLLIGRFLQCFVMETKHFRDGLKITEEGEFLRFNGYTKHYEGIPSPIEQNKRHIAVLKEAFGKVQMPSRFGIPLSPTFMSYVLVSPKSRIIRPKRLDTSSVIKADMVYDAMSKFMDSFHVLNIMSSLSKLVSLETIENVGRQLVAMHQPLRRDYLARFGVVQRERDSARSQTATTSASVSAEQTEEPVAAPMCRHCGSEDLTIEFGRFGYYFKCRGCSGNTPIKIQCEKGHKERIRKKGRQFFRDCVNAGFHLTHFAGLVLTHPAALNQDIVAASRGAP